jgi:hypothetical protein
MAHLDASNHCDANEMLERRRMRRRRSKLPSRIAHRDRRIVATFCARQGDASRQSERPRRCARRGCTSEESRLE